MKSTVRPVRFPEDLDRDIAAEIARTNENRRAEPFDFSTWVRTACREKLAHSRRSRKGKASSTSSISSTSLPTPATTLAPLTISPAVSPTMPPAMVLDCSPHLPNGDCGGSLLLCTSDETTAAPMSESSNPA